MTAATQARYWLWQGSLLVSVTYPNGPETPDLTRFRSIGLDRVALHCGDGQCTLTVNSGHTVDAVALEFMTAHVHTVTMYNARARIDHATWLEDLERIADRLELSADARTTATDLFLANVPDKDRSKPAVLAASIYAGSLVAGDGRTQCAVAEAADVSRLSIQQRWKSILADAGLDPPRW